jgi:signal transduction histidine kinase
MTAMEATRVLVVEDSPTQAAELQCVLEDAGYQVHLAADALRAMDYVLTGRPDLVLSDIVMPGASGFDLCRQIKRHRLVRHIPVVLLTQLDDPSHLIEGLESGADSYVMKPYEAADLLARLASVLARAARPDESRDAPPLQIELLGKPHTITRDRRRILDYFAAAFEDSLRAKERQLQSEARAAAEREQRQANAALVRFGQELLGSLDTQVILRRLCELTVELLGADRSHVFRWDADGAAFVPVAGHGATARESETLQGSALRWPEVAHFYQHLRTDEVVPLDRETTGEHGWAGPSGAGATLCLAVRAGDVPLGFLAVSRRGPGKPFGPRETHIAHGMVQVAALALENARLHEALEQADRLKSDFVNTMSHELRTPLQVILGYAQLLQGDAFGHLTAQQLEGVKRIAQNARELADLINAILDLSRLDRGRLVMTPRRLVPTALIAEVRTRLAQREIEPAVEVVFDVPADLPPMYTDPNMAKVVLNNLVDNALKFTERGRVAITAQRSGQGIAFAVSDTGIGIPAAALSDIFECFRQVDASMTRPYGGVGLGLYIVRRMVAELGGQVTVQSEVDRGSTFRVWLPLDATTARSPRDTAMPDDAAAPRRAEVGA